jgi:ubiquinone/menaquinone biosynthesis C-methylase UbiE
MSIEERFAGANVVDADRRSPYWGEHVARYRFARSFVSQKVVLDIACGTGYGLGVLKGDAKHIVGVDVDPDAASEARRECDERASVVLASGLKLPFRDNSFEIITSFETLEHLHDRGGFVAELRRVLRTGGKLILSTPNANYTQPVDGVPSNPYHIHEYEPSELVSELESHFSVNQLLGQTLDDAIRISPFEESQRRLPKDLRTQTLLLSWKVLNKMPLPIRESVSELVWKKPFYPTEDDYRFSEETVEYAPVLVAICS